MRRWLAVILVSYGLFVWWFVAGLSAASQQIATAQIELAKPPVTPIKIVRFDGIKPGLPVPAMSWLNHDRLWAYVSAKSPIDKKFQPQLSQLTVAHGHWIGDDRIAKAAADDLEKLFTSAKQAKRPIIVTSAYRSASAQQQLYDETVAQSGINYAREYIAQPGSSEHQLGLSVDLSSFSTACQRDFANCWLGDADAAWLAKNAPDYGFILRYPPAKSHLTGVAHEPWHFRYVGTKMAKFIQASNLTFDEVVAKIKNTK